MAWIQSHQQLRMRIKHNITIKYNGICQLCGKRGRLRIIGGCYIIAYEKRKNWQGKKYAFEIHHIKPIQYGGTNKENNLILLCHKCHRNIYHTKSGEQEINFGKTIY